MRVLKILLAGVVALSGCGGGGNGSGGSTPEPATASVSGMVTGLSGTATVALNGADSKQVNSDGSFSFDIRLTPGASYTVTITTQPNGQTCSVIDGSGTVPTTSVQNVQVTCVTRTHIVGGNISGLIGSLTLRNGNDLYTTSSDGPFAFAVPVAEGAPYAVGIETQPATQSCSVSNGAGAVGTTNVENVTIVCSTNSFAVGGIIQGLMGDVTLQNNGIDALTLNSNGTFQFPVTVAQGSPYTVSVRSQPTIQICSVANGNGMIGSSNVGGVVVNCSTNAFKLGGTVSGLTGSVVLQNNGGQNMSLYSDGAFTFATPVAQASNYAVTVLTQPVNQICAVTNGSAVMGMGDVANIGVHCTHTATTLSVTAQAVIPVNGASASINVTNVGYLPALNVAASLPPGWTSVTEDTSNCPASLAPGNSCTLSFTSTAPYVAQGGIAITAGNVASSPSIALAFSIDDFLVFSVDSANTASVIADSDLTGGQWALVLTDVVAATSLIDGAANTAAIVAAVGSNAPAANSCATSTLGGATAGIWYLPAVCQLVTAAEFPGCSSATPSIYTNLTRLGFGMLRNNSQYWTSNSEGTASARQITNTSMGVLAPISDKAKLLPVRCARSIGY